MIYTFKEGQSSESQLVDGIQVIHGSMAIDGNLEVKRDLTVNKVVVSDGTTKNPAITIKNGIATFNKVCSFKEGCKFCNDKVLIGVEKTYNSGLVYAGTLKADDRFFIGDSLFSIVADERKIVADTFKMTLKSLIVDGTVESDKILTDYVDTETLMAKKIVTDEMQIKEFTINKFTGLQIKADQIKAVDIVAGSGVFKNGIQVGSNKVDQTGSTGPALVVNGGEIVANWGIVSHTANNRFQTMEIMGGGSANQVCFMVDSKVDSLFKGDVTIQDSNLVLDNSKLVSDEIVIMNVETNEDEPTKGVRITTDDSWDQYENSMVQEIPTSEQFGPNDYDPYRSVNEAIARNKKNYTTYGYDVKSILNPINYMMEQKNPIMPKKFQLNKGVYRIDTMGNAMVKNLVSEQGKFSKLSAYELNVNKVQLDKLVTTSVASNVVDTDNLLKSRGIAEFDGAVHSKADIFIEKNSTINVDEGTAVTLKSGSSLTMENGTSLNLGSDTDVKINGLTELNVNKLVFVDDETGRKYRIKFREASPCEGCGVIMEYYKVNEENTIRETKLNSNELDAKLKALGL